MRAALRLVATAAAVLVAGGVAAQVALPGPVEETPLVRDAFATGTLDRGGGALAPDLWRGADTARLESLLAVAPARFSGPALGDALRRILLSPGSTPDGAPASLGGRKLLALVRAGFIDEARTIASLSSAPTQNPAIAEALAVADLLDGDLARACERSASLASGRDALFWVKLRVLCYAAAGERDAADLTLALLRESGGLSPTDETLFAALAAGIAPGASVAPHNALQLAAIRQLSMRLTPGLLDRAGAGVLKSIARDATFDDGVRVAAANAAAAMGAVQPGDLIAFYESFDIDEADLQRASVIILERPFDPMADVVAFQAIRRMAAPEFLRDKARRIAEMIAAPGGFARAYAVGLLYAGEIEALEGALISPQEAMRFAAARMAIGDGDGAARWLFAALGAGGMGALEEREAMEFIELVNFLAVLDPISAAAVAAAADVAVAPPAMDTSAASAGALDAVRLRLITEAALEAAIDDIPGQAGLAAIAMAAHVGGSDTVANVVIDQSLRAAGLNDLRRRIAFDAVWRRRFSAQEVAASQPAQSAEATGDDGLTPRLKPRASE